jgi:hypothetical protein
MKRLSFSGTYRLLITLLALVLLGLQVARSQALPQSGQPTGVQQSEDGMARYLCHQQR